MLFISKSGFLSYLFVVSIMLFISIQTTNKKRLVYLLVSSGNIFEFISALKFKLFELIFQKHLRRYDFDFDEWPVDYISENVDGHSGRDSVISLQRSSFKSKYELVVDGFLKETLAFVLSEHVGLRLMFPGSIGLLKWICCEFISYKVS